MPDAHRQHAWGCDDCLPSLPQAARLRPSTSGARGPGRARRGHRAPAGPRPHPGQPLVGRQGAEDRPDSGAVRGQEREDEDRGEAGAEEPGGPRARAADRREHAQGHAGALLQEAGGAEEAARGRGRLLPRRRVGQSQGTEEPAHRWRAADHGEAGRPVRRSPLRTAPLSPCLPAFAQRASAQRARRPGAAAFSGVAAAAWPSWMRALTSLSGRHAAPCGSSLDAQLATGTCPPPVVLAPKWAASLSEGRPGVRWYSRRCMGLCCCCSRLAEPTL
mmetsp:Transcript_80881/g.261910  ORF Transcript_80881/g.261910 Transcript_80881/m.261910 type:complete len:275 (+) Transcript_80881:459-1283(+)